MAFRRSVNLAVRSCSTSSKGDGKKNKWFAASAGFLAIGGLQIKRIYERDTGCDIGIFALLEGRWGEPFPDRDDDSHDDTTAFTSTSKPETSVAPTSEPAPASEPAPTGEPAPTSEPVPTGEPETSDDVQNTTS